MLGKLLKHEWKEISVIPCVLSVVLLVLSVISGFSFLGIREGAADVSRFMTIMLWLLFYFALIAVSLGITIYLAVHFYKTMYTDEGYLTHTLPVSGRELLVEADSHGCMEPSDDAGCGSGGADFWRHGNAVCRKGRHCGYDSDMGRDP